MKREHENGRFKSTNTVHSLEFMIIFLLCVKSGTKKCAYTG